MAKENTTGAADCAGVYAVNVNAYSMVYTGMLHYFKYTVSTTVSITVSITVSKY